MQEVINRILTENPQIQENYKKGQLGVSDVVVNMVMEINPDYDHTTVIMAVITKLAN